MKNDFATDEEIRLAHDILLPGKPDFESDKINVIKCNESCDVQACPGSGKTTVLLAKLAILAKRMPFSDGKGICVLTHTNVAINEIKTRFGGISNILLNYPNFCGTIQSFVDQFLAIPFYNSFNKKSIVSIDDDRANAIIRKAFFATSWEDKKTLNHLLRKNDTYEKACQAKDWETVNKLKQDLVFNTFYDFYNKKFYRKYGDTTSIASYAGKNLSKTYEFLNSVRLSVLNEGVIEYQDAYSLALAYEKLSSIEESLSRRFKYVFIDEMQDSNQMQTDLLDKLFGNDKIIVQRFGDPYQAIYDSLNDDACWSPNNPLHLNSSKRFGDSIAKVLRTVCIENNNSLQGASNIYSVKPIMIVFKTAESVLPAFVNILRETTIDGKSIATIAKEEREQDPLKRHNIKAIAYVGKLKDDSIHQYFDTFNNSMSGTRRPFSTNISLNTFLQKDCTENNPSNYRKQILNAIIYTLDLAGVKSPDGRRHSISSFLEWLKSEDLSMYDTLLLNLSDWIIKISDSKSNVDKDVFNDVKSFISTLLSKLEKDMYEVNVLNFLKEENETFYNTNANELPTNIFKDGNIEVELATVHSVKGETHAATLYLETKYYKYESEHFGEQLCGVPYQTRKGGIRIKSALKVAYVGMSRPKYLLCYAIQEDRFDKLNKEKLKDVWNIHKAD